MSADGGTGGDSIEEENNHNNNNTDYESDPEVVKMSLKMRRRVASDDEIEDDVEERGIRRSEVVDSDGESDDQGGAANYDDEDDEEEEEEEEEYYDEYDDEEVVGEEYAEVEEREIGDVEVENHKEAKIEKKGEGERGEGGEEVVVGEEEKKEAEPFSVPTSGAFYMHDDRFRGNVGGRGGGRHRRTFDGRKLWESKDERKWGHDKFEELNLHDRHYEEGRRTSKGSYRGRGKARGANGGYSRGSRVKEYSGDSNQKAPAKNVRGRGPRRYQPVMKNKGETHSPPNKQSARSSDRNSHTGSGRMASRSFDNSSHNSSGRIPTSTGNSNVEHETASSKKVGSNLSSASPPFYPSGASTKDIASTQKKEIHTGNHARNMRSSANANSSMPISDPILRGKNVIDSTGNDTLYIDEAVNNLHLKSSASSSSSPNQFAHPRGQGRVVASPRPAVFQPSQTNNQVNKVSPQATQANQRSPVLTQANQRSSILPQGQTPSQGVGQQLAQRPLVASQNLSPPKAGKGTIQGSGRGSLVYGGAQVMGSGGNVGAGHGDPNMPAFFPVMQFGGQHPGGMGVPAVGMAFPGYVGQPNGIGTSEMTWLPMLASAAGALGASYCPPYLSVDGNYHSRPTGQTSALPAPSKDNNLSKSINEIKPQQRSEVAIEEFSQRQNKPRRYSEMSFSQ